MWVKLTGLKDQPIGVDVDRVIRMDGNESGTLLQFEATFPDSLRKVSVKETVDEIIGKVNGARASDGAEKPIAPSARRR